MCGRYSAGQLTLPALAETFQADPAEAAGHEPSWNVAPTTQVVVVTPTADTADTDTADTADAGDADGGGAARKLRRLRWGLVPNWAKDPKMGNRMINVRSETAPEKSTFKKLLARSRCILPADGFYEWQDLGADPSTSTRKRRKQPFYITTRDGAPLALAGLWTTNKHADPAGPMDTCTILTTSANQFMSSIHHRMPVILPESAWDTWLDPAVDDLDTLASLLVPAADDRLRMWPVDPAVNNVRSNVPELTHVLEGHEPVTWQPQ